MKKILMLATLIASLLTLTTANAQVSLSEPGYQTHIVGSQVWIGYGIAAGYKGQTLTISLTDQDNNEYQVYSTVIRTSSATGAGFFICLPNLPDGPYYITARLPKLSAAPVAKTTEILLVASVTSPNACSKVVAGQWTTVTFADTATINNAILAGGTLTENGALEIGTRYIRKTQGRKAWYELQVFIPEVTPGDGFVLFFGSDDKKAGGQRMSQPFQIIKPVTRR